jgi:hypothetical protein
MYAMQDDQNGQRIIVNPSADVDRLAVNNVVCQMMLTPP